jgi:hypothetical protein
MIPRWHGCGQQRTVRTTASKIVTVHRCAGLVSCLDPWGYSHAPSNALAHVTQPPTQPPTPQVVAREARKGHLAANPMPKDELAGLFDADGDGGSGSDSDGDSVE